MQISILAFCILGMVTLTSALQSKSLTVYDPALVTFTNTTDTMVAVTDDIIGYAFPNDNKVVYYLKQEAMAGNVNNLTVLTMSSTNQILEHHSNKKYVLTVFSRPGNNFCFYSAYFTGTSIYRDYL